MRTQKEPYRGMVNEDVTRSNLHGGGRSDVPGAMPGGSVLRLPHIPGNPDSLYMGAAHVRGGTVLFFFESGSKPLTTPAFLPKHKLLTVRLNPIETGRGVGSSSVPANPSSCDPGEVRTNEATQGHSHEDFFNRFLKDESGATAIEYGLIAALIAVTIIAALQAVSDELTSLFGRVSAALQTAGT